MEKLKVGDIVNWKDNSATYTKRYVNEHGDVRARTVTSFTRKNTGEIISIKNDMLSLKILSKKGYLHKIDIDMTMVTKNKSQYKPWIHNQLEQQTENFYI